MVTVRRHKITVLAATITLMVTGMARQRELTLPCVS